MTARASTASRPSTAFMSGGARARRPGGRDPAAARRLSRLRCSSRIPPSVLPEGAILLRPAHASRIGEAEAIAPALHRRFERVLELDEGYADGGDILMLPDEMIGLWAAPIGQAPSFSSSWRPEFGLSCPDRRGAARRAPLQDRLRAARRGDGDRHSGLGGGGTVRRARRLVDARRRGEGRQPASDQRCGPDRRRLSADGGAARRRGRDAGRRSTSRDPEDRRRPVVHVAAVEGRAFRAPPARGEGEWRQWPATSPSGRDGSRDSRRPPSSAGPSR